MADVYENDGQDVDDETWISHCGRRGWIAFSKDANITRAHAETIEVSATVVFLLPDQSMPGREQLARYIHHRHRIARLARKGGPAVYKLYPRKVERVLP